MAIIILNVIAWNSAAFCDAYISSLFLVWVNTYGRLSNLFSFSVGEWLILLGLLLVALAVICLVCLVIKGIICRIRKIRVAEQGRVEKKYLRVFAWILLCVCLIMTLNCFLLYHATTFSVRYFGEETGDYEPAELLQLYNKIAYNCNTLAAVVPRDENGKLCAEIDGDIVTKEEALAELGQQARRAMLSLGQDYKQLDGYYPRPKAMFFSDFMCQQYMGGYYFPFSMEANYNRVMEIGNIPATMCHELAHLRGFIYEDEANFIGYLACIESEDLLFQYSGYLSVLNYVYNDVYKMAKNNKELFAELVAEYGLVQVDEQVAEDNIFVTEEEWDRINGKALIDTETVDAASDVFVETNLKVNGIADGMISYSRVVRLLLQYERVSK